MTKVGSCTLIKRIIVDIDDAVKIETRERFWSATAAANLTGALVANAHLGLHNINIRRVFDWLVEEVKTMQDSTRLNINDFAALVGEFLTVSGTVLARGPRCGDARHTVDAPVIMPGREHASPDGGGLLS